MYRAIEDENGSPNAELMQLAEFLLRDPKHSKAVIKWVTRNQVVPLLRKMATHEEEISLVTVARHHDGIVSNFFSSMLMDSGVIARQNFQRVRFEVWQSEYLEQIHRPKDRHLLNRYGRWSLIPVFAESEEETAINQRHLYSRSKSQVRAAGHFLEFLRKRDIQFESAPARALDLYLAQTNPYKVLLTPFIRWAHINHLTKLNLPYVPMVAPSPRMDDGTRHEWVSRLRSDTDLPLNARIAGLLCITYGLHLTRVLSLRISEVEEVGPVMSVQFGKDPMILSRPLAELLRQQLDQLEADPTLEVDWVFPSPYTGFHISPGAVSRNLKRVGLSIGIASPAARFGLARQVPPVVMSDLLGVSISSSSRWSDVAGYSWNDYPRLRDDSES